MHHPRIGRLVDHADLGTEDVALLGPGRCGAVPVSQMIHRRTPAALAAAAWCRHVAHNLSPVIPRPA